MTQRPKAPTPTSQLTLPLAREATPGAVTKTVTEKPAGAAHTAAKPRPKTKRLAQALTRHLGAGAELVLTDNRTTLLSHSVKKGRIIARVHQMFLDGDDGLFNDIADYMSTGTRAAGERIDAFVAARDHLLMHHAPPLKPDAGVGQHHDLDVLFAEINAQYFADAVTADIQWGRSQKRRGRGRQRSITFGTYDERAHRITIHPVLDGHDIPRSCVARVVHHEMLHAVFPDERSASGRRLVHGPLFKRAEALFAEAESTDAWFDAQLARLLARASNTKKR